MEIDYRKKTAKNSVVFPYMYEHLFGAESIVRSTRVKHLVVVAILLLVARVAALVIVIVYEYFQLFSIYSMSCNSFRPTRNLCYFSGLL